MKTKYLRPFALCFISSIGLAPADIIPFDLSPAGTNNAVGLRPANEVPAVLNSTGSGNEISGGITFNTDTSILSFSMGYGSSTGFTDLTGAATVLHIHGPAGVGGTAPPLFNLASVHFPSPVPATGGLIFGSIQYNSAQAASLLAGQQYVNIHTSTNTGGEIRGQLIRQNASPNVIPPLNATVECGVPVSFSATVSDFDGDAVQVVWSLNGEPVQTDNIAAGQPPTKSVLTYTGALHDVGLNTLTVTATDSVQNVTISSATITVQDTIAPVIASLTVSPKVLWPPNHKMVPIRVTADVVDACGETTWKILSVTSNQAVDAKGSGNTSPDWLITGDQTVSLRAERAGPDKGGRVYTITVQATDEAGNQSATATVTVLVPHNQGKGGGKDKNKDKDKGKGKDK